MSTGHPRNRALRCIFRRVRAATLGMGASVMLYGNAYAADELNHDVDFNIPAQTLERALQEWGAQAHVQIMLASTVATTQKSPQIKGRFTARIALNELLKGSALSYHEVGDHTVTIEPASASEVADQKSFRIPGAPEANLQGKEINAGEDTSKGPPEERPAVDNKAPSQYLEEVVVTGTHIRGINPDSFPVQVYTLDQVEMTGSTTIEDFFDRLPGNFNSLRANAPGGAQGAFSNSNEAGVNGIDLRGLGVGSTLVLVNGERLAPSSSGTTPDISMIPLYDIERIEVLTDGASAIYGSDAVGGVVNFVMKDRFDGTETDLGYGTVTRGSHAEAHAQQTFGGAWNSGTGLISVGESLQTPLMAADRDYAKGAGLFTLLPAYQRQNIFGSAKQTIVTDTEAFANALYSIERNHIASDLSFLGQPPVSSDVQHTRKESLFVNVGTRVTLPGDTNVEVTGTYSRATQAQDGELGPIGSPLPPTFAREASRDLEVAVRVDGRLLDVPAGSAKFAVGAGFTHDQFDYTSLATDGTYPTGDLRRTTRYEYGELFVPIVGAHQQVPLVTRLELTLAARSTHYSDFGSNTSPKIGVLWAPISQLKVRASYAQSFRAPFLYQLDPSSNSWALFPAFITPAIAAQYSLPPTANVLFVEGNNPSIGPEKARTKTVGLDFLPVSDRDLKVGATYFDINYTNRIAAPPANLAFTDPGSYPSLFNTHPTLSQVANAVIGTNFFATPGVNINDVSAIAAATSLLLDARYANIAVTRMSGLDVDLEYTGGGFVAGAQVSRVFHYWSRQTPTDPQISILNTVANPLGFRARSWAGVSVGPWRTQLGINFTGSYSNPSASPTAKVASWTTLDWSTRYAFGRASGLTRGLELLLSVQNLFDRDPPYVGLSSTNTVGLLQPIGYDPKNASPLGRFIALGLSKTW